MVEGNLKWYSLITNCIMDFINFMPHANIMIFRLGLHWWGYFRIFCFYCIWIGNVHLINKYSPPDLDQCFYFGFTHDISCNRLNESSTKMFRILDESGKISPIVQLSLEETVSLMLFLLIMNKYSGLNYMPVPFHAWMCRLKDHEVYSRKFEKLGPHYHQLFGGTNSG